VVTILKIIATLKRKIYEFVSTCILAQFKKMQNSLLRKNWRFFLILKIWKFRLWRKCKKSAVPQRRNFELCSNELDSPKQKRQLGTAQRVGADAFEIAIFRLELLL